MEEEKGGEKESSKEDKIAETAARGVPDPSDQESSSRPRPPAVNHDNVPRGGRKREEPASLRELSEAMEGWKSKQQETQRRLMEEFDHLGRDISQMQHDTVNFKSEIDIVKSGLQRRASMDRNRRSRTSILGSSSQSMEDAPNPKDVSK